jgi:hypothetical protein
MLRQLQTHPTRRTLKDYKVYKVSNTRVRLQRIRETDMKILLLILGLFFSGGLFANMDKICSVSLDLKQNKHTEYILENCERNNILRMDSVFQGWVTTSIARWCRYDREIQFIKMSTETKLGKYKLTCVLYDNKPRN